VKFVGKLLAAMRNQCFKRSSIIFDGNFEFTDFNLGNLAGELYASHWSEVTYHCYRF
jgi:hypothetical protein